MKKLSFALIMLALFVGCAKETEQPMREQVDAFIEQRTFDRPYKVIIKDDHEVQLVYGMDTVRLYLENSGRLNEETVIFIKK